MIEIDKIFKEFEDENGYDLVTTESCAVTNWLIKKLVEERLKKRYSIEQLEKCIEHWGLCKVEKQYIERFLGNR